MLEIIKVICDSCGREVISIHKNLSIKSDQTKSGSCEEKEDSLTITIPITIHGKNKKTK